ncbi:Uncharacterised protein [Catenibacterium mitsuokai]|nr:Uncharacterised protein [Catenibacterium mitsuokai]
MIVAALMYIHKTHLHCMKESFYQSFSDRLIWGIINDFSPESCLYFLGAFIFVAAAII